MISDEVLYVAILVASVLIGFPLRNLKSTLERQIATCAVGLICSFGICRWDGLHSFITFLGNLLIIKFSKQHTSLLSFLWCFIYLFFFRCATIFSFSKPSPLANAIQLILTLKLVSVAIEIHDYRNKKTKTDETKVENEKFQLSLDQEPSSFDILCYTYCYTGLFTGPFFKYRTYYDYISMDSKISVSIPWKDEIFSRLKKIVIFGILYACAAHYFSIDYVKSDAFYTEPMWYKVFYMVPIFFIGRMRFYSAWLLSECSFISLTLGAYAKDSLPRSGHGPTQSPVTKQNKDNNDFSYETIRNIDPYGCDFSPTVRLGMRSWNMGVQWWLANYVHKRWPGHLKQFRVPAVMAVSAYWHGIDPGFFGAFLTMPFVMAAEDLCASVIKKRLPSSLHSSYDWINWFAKMRSFEYMYMAFALLTWHDTFRYWKSTYFWLHIISFIIIAICMVFKSSVKARDKKQYFDSGKKLH